jgi:hypothetical protein
MPSTGDITVTGTLPSGTTETFTILATDAATLTKGDVVVKFKGKQNGTTKDPHDIELTRANYRRIEYEIEA